ncbi:MAG: pirin family protein, partial [Janthinobacterium lividum]
GIKHSEYNASEVEPVHFLQIWIVPGVKGVAPRYQQVHFAPAEKRGRFRTIISPDGVDGSLSVYQDARVYAGLFDGDETASVSLEANRYAYVHVACGGVTLNGQALEEGDGVRVRNERELRFTDGHDAEVLVFDMRAQEAPRM